MHPILGRITAFALSSFVLVSFVASADEFTKNTSRQVQIDVANATLPEVVAALASGWATSVELTQAYLHRINELDRAGPRLNSIIVINPAALRLAQDSDERRRAGEPLSPLDGVPVLLKDNIESKDQMATTAGSLALQDNITGRDSPLVAQLRAAGAIILGKTNLSQWANFRSDYSISGWSSVGGLVKNPHVLDRQACGSSSGSAVAVAAGLAPVAVGTETNGSIICPAQVNGVVGFKPSFGLLPNDFMVPISSTQDTAGPIAKTVSGAALMLDAMTGWDHRFYERLDSNVLKGLRVGVLDFSRNDSPKLNALFDRAIDRIEQAGAIVVRIDHTEPVSPDFWASAGVVLEAEFKELIGRYLSESPAKLPVSSLADLIAFNERYADRELALFGQDVFENALNAPSLDSKHYSQALALIRRNAREKGLDAIMSENDVTVLFAPSGPISPPVDVVNGDVWPAWAGAGAFAAIAGYPNITVPMGFAGGIPLGASFIASADQDALVLSVALAFETAGPGFVAPAYLPTVRID